MSPFWGPLAVWLVVVFLPRYTPDLNLNPLRVVLRTRQGTFVPFKPQMLNSLARPRDIMAEFYWKCIWDPVKPGVPLHGGDFRSVGCDFTAGCEMRELTPKLTPGNSHLTETDSLE